MSLQKLAPISGVPVSQELDLSATAFIPSAAETPPAPPRLSPEMRNRAAILTGPILSTLLKLALPTMTVLLAQTAVNIAEAYYVGYLGTAALAGVALVFPVFMLMTMMSNGGLGSGVA